MNKRHKLWILISFLVIVISGAGNATAQTNSFPSSGNVGVGIATPSYQLDGLKDASNGLSLFRFSNSDFPSSGQTGQAVGLTFHLQSNLNGNAKGVGGSVLREAARIVAGKDDSWYDTLYQGTHINSFLSFYTSYQDDKFERVRITSTGNVGIGTASPNAILEVSKSGTGSNQGMVRFLQGSITSGNYNAIDFGRSENSNEAGMVAYTYNSSASVISIGHYGDSVINGVGLNVLKGGNVGIGTTSPADPLQIDAPGGWAMRLKYTGDGQYLRLSANQISSYTSAGAGNNLFLNLNAGYVGVGTTTPTAKLDVAGDIKASGTIFAKYQDVAEWVPSSEQLAAGTVVVLDATKSNQVVASATAYDTRVAGVISAQPGITLGEKSDSKVLVATTGRVRVKVDASRGPIAIGDLLVTSDVPGLAMKSEAVNLGGVQIHRPGTIIGKALEPLAKGEGEILVLLSLQ